MRFQSVAAHQYAVLSATCVAEVSFYVGDCSIICRFGHALPLFSVGFAGFSERFEDYFRGGEGRSYNLRQ